MKSLQNLSYKTLFTILFFALAGIVFFLRIGGKTTKVSAAWWDDGWNYRKAININNSGSAQINTQFKLFTNYDLSSLVSVNKIQSDLDDIRFTDQNGNLLNYWIEDATNNSADIWIKLPSLPNGDTTLYLYYGNSTANSGQSIMGKTPDNPGITCKAIQLSGGNSGVYYIDPDGLEATNSYQTYCDMSGEGGWTLLMKAEGNTTTFDYNATYWTTSNTLNPNDPEINHNTDAKFESFNSLSIDKVRATWPSTGHTMVENITTTTALNLFQTTVDLGPSMAQFDYTNFPYQTGYQRYGFNLTCFSSRKVRWGWMFNNEADCGSNDCTAGIGLMNYNSTTNGGYVTCCSNKPNGVYPLRVRIWGKENNIPIPSISFLNSTPQPEESGGGPIAYWKFDEGSGLIAYDSSGNNNGTINGSTYYSEDQCVFGKCLQFNGSNNFINTGTIPSLSTFTLSAWIKAGTDVSDFRTIIDKTNNMNDRNFWLALESGTGQLSLRFSIAGASTTYLANTALNDNKWHYVTATYDNSYVKLYVDGKSNMTPVSKTGVPNTGNVSSHIGNQNGTRYFNGLIDDVKIYPYARTADQIKLDYNSRGSLSGSSANLGIKSNTAPSLKSSLIAYYKFDEGSGTTAYDSVGSNNGTLAGTTLPALQSGENCISGKCLSFNETDSIVSIGTTLGTFNQYTISFWAKHNTSNNMPIASKGTTSFYWYGDSSWKYVHGGTSGEYYYPKSISIPYGTWGYFAVTYDGEKVSIYRNGILEGTKATTGSAVFNTGFYIGQWGNLNYSYSFNGSIDEVKIYNKALTADEVKQDYNQGSAISFGTTNQTIGGTTTSLDYCIPGDTTYCAPPIAEWKMDEGVGTSIVDTSGNSNTGTISGATFTQGKIGKSLNFNGTSDYVSLPTFTYTTNATISVWVKGSYLNGNQIIIGSPNSISLGIYNVGSSKGIIGFSNTSKAVGIANNFINDSWNHLSVVIDNLGNTTYYCNGQILTNSGTNYWTWSSGTYIGRRDSGSYFKGQIDQIKIYNYARTPAQIAYDYNKGAPVGWWKFDECQGNTAYDWSGNQNNGTINIGSGGSQNSLGTCQIGTSAAWTNGATGKTNSSLNFDGTDDYVNIPDNNFLNPRTSDFSISMWIFKNNKSTSYRGIFTKNYQQAFGVFDTTNLANDPIGLYIKSGSNANNINFSNYYGKWTFLTWTVSNSTNKQRSYVNGIFNNETNFAVGDVGSTYPINIGRYSIDQSKYFEGKLDDIRLYNYALTPEQVKQIYNGGAVNFR